jgi:hypothetical protein
VYQIFQPPASKTNFAEAAAVFEVVVSLSASFDPNQLIILVAK